MRQLPRLCCRRQVPKPSKSENCGLSVIFTRELKSGLLALALVLSPAGYATTLYDATVSNDMDKVRELVAQGANVDDRSSNAYVSANNDLTPLLRALLGGNAEMAKFLIGKGANVNYQSWNHVTPLHAAAQKNLLEIARLLIKQGAKVNSQTKLGQTPLHLAAELGNTAVAKLLIEKGADINSYDGMGRTPLIQAAIVGAGETAKLLLTSGADVSLRNRQGKTAAEMALIMGKQASYDAITSFVARAETDKKLQQEQKELDKRFAAQPCRLNESHWLLLSGKCRNNLAEGPGEAESFDRVWRFKGIFSNGRFVSGELWQNGYFNFVGPFANGVQHGKGLCSDPKEACEWQNGVRIDALHQGRLRAQEQERRELAQQERDDERDSARRKALRECERRVRVESDEDTEVHCDSEGNLSYNRHNKGSLERGAWIQDYADKRIDEVKRLAAGSTAPAVAQAATGRKGDNSTVSQKVTVTGQAQQSAQDTRRKQEAPQPAQSAKPGVTSTSTAPTTGTPGPTAREWGDAVAEAIVACWSNGKGTQWFCDGPLQETLVADNDIAKVRDLAGCDARNDSPHEIGTSGKYRVFGCGRGLKPNERDMRKIRGVSGGSNRYRCLKADMDAGKPCRHLSDRG